MVQGLDIALGRQAFGLDPAGYDAARPPYPDWVFDRIDTMRPFAGAKVFEIGPGTGLATRALLRRSAAILVAVEPDPRLAGSLRLAALPGMRVLEAGFEAADLPADAFDIGVAATSFHWLDQAAALGKVGRLLKSGGVWAAFANVFGDPDRGDAFHEATHGLLGGLPEGPSNGAQGIPYALDDAARLADLRTAAVFTDLHAERRTWTLILDAAGIRALYATFSNISLRPADERERILDGLAEIAQTEFGGRVERNMVTSLHAARRI